MAARIGRGRASPSARPGQALVEFAIIVPIFVLLVVGVFELGFAWKKHQVLSDGVREAARSWASSCTVTADTLSQRVRRHLTNSAVDTTGLQVTVAGSLAACSCAPPAGSVCPDSLGVQAQLPHTFVFMRPFMGWTPVDATITMSTYAWMPQIR